METSKNLISVIIPVYNVEKYLVRCVGSVLKQSYQNFEIILVDDGSTDSSGSICDDFAREYENIRTFHKPNGGLSDARNFGVERARGDLLTFIDSDDYIDSDCLSYLLELLSGARTRMSVCQLRVITSGGRIIENGTSGNAVLDPAGCIKKMLYHDGIDTSACAKLYDRHLFDAVLYPKGKYFEDIGTTYALMMQCDKIAIGYESKYNYIYRNASIVNSNFNPTKLDLIEMTDKMARDVGAAYPDLRQAALRRRVYARFSTLNQMFYVREAKYIKERSRLIRFIRKHSKEVLNDPLAPDRDKKAIRILMLGFPVYRIFWKLYLKIKKG